MDNDEIHRLDLLGFDEKTESWFLDTCETRQLLLSRSTLEGIVRLYNSKHTGNPLRIVDQRSLDRLEENNRRLAETVRDLYLHIDRRNRRGILRRLVRGARLFIDLLLVRPLRRRR